MEVPDRPDRGPATVAAGRGDALVAAIQFLTRVPLTTQPVSAVALAQCPVYFPLVGTLIGVITGGVLLGACQLWPVWLAVIAALAAEALLTRALHEDALADFCDAF